MSVLTPNELAELAADMQARNKVLRQEIREELLNMDKERFHDVANGALDQGDEAVADALADLQAVTIDRQIREIRAIEAAQKRMAAGSYGVCIDCAEPILFARLKAYPTAERCTACQEQHDALHAHEAAPSL